MMKLKTKPRFSYEGLEQYLHHHGDATVTTEKCTLYLAMTSVKKFLCIPPSTQVEEISFGIGAQAPEIVC